MTMEFFRRKHYQSDVTLFLLQLHKDNPTLVQDQLEGYNRLRNIRIDRAEATAMNLGKIAQPAYPYFENNLEPVKPILPNNWNRPR